MKDGRALEEAGLAKYSESGTLRWTLTPLGIAFGLESLDYTPHDIQEMLDYALTLAYFHPNKEGETAIPYIYRPGSSRLVLVLGENAGGKSFFRRILSGMTAQAKASNGFDPPRDAGPFPVGEFIALSMEARTSSNFMSAMIYGAEKYRSTGENSAHTVKTGISTVQGRAHTSIIYWDEPDIGMSAGIAAGAGIEIAKLVREAGPLVQAICVTTHSPPLVNRLLDLDPHYLYLGDDSEGAPRDLRAWMDHQLTAEPVSPQELLDRARRRFKLIRKILKK